MRKETTTVTLGTGALFFELMFLMFLGLKISNTIDWAWVWVFAPLWVPILAVCAVIGLMFLWVVIATRGAIKKEVGNDKVAKKQIK